MDLSDPGTLRRFLERHGLAAKKGLGQHFLCSSRVVQAIVSRAEGFRGALEIGPGPGVLAGPLSEALESVVLLEIDSCMIAALAESAPKARVVEGDALEMDLGSLLESLPSPRLVVSNLPYYITGPLLTRIAEVRGRFDRAVLMMQREVGQRVLAPAGDSKRGSLSVFLQMQFAIRKVADAPAGAFLPPPKVDSVVLEFKPAETGIAESEESAFFVWMRKGFAQPRKTLANNLRAAGASPEGVAFAMKASGIDAKARPADLSGDQWRKLFGNLFAP